MRQLMLVLALAASPTTRESADSSPFPSVTAQPLALNLPVIGKRIGARPEEIGGRVYGAKTAEAWRRQGKAVPDTQWYGQAFGGAAVVGYDLSRGRVSRVVMVFGAERSFEAAMAKLEKAGKVKKDVLTIPGKVSVAVREIKVDGSPAISLEASTAGWYLLDHPTLPANLATAIKAGQVVPGMDIEQVEATKGRPSKVEELDGLTVLRWTTTAKSLRGTRPGANGKVEMIFDEVEKVVASATVKDGRVVAAK
jgi:hypothetical protein